MREIITNYNPITTNSKPLDGVQGFVYLGSKMTTDGDCDQEINTRISIANQAFEILRFIWRSTIVRIQAKIRLYKNNVISVLLCGSYCLKTTVNTEKELTLFQNKCLRRILGIIWPNIILNEDLRTRTEVSTKQDIIQVSRDMTIVCLITCSLEQPYTLPLRIKESRGD